MIIEFVGVPGSGKSTVATLVAARLTERGIPTDVRTGAHHHYRGPLWRERSRVLAGNLRLTAALAAALLRDRRKEAMSWLFNVARRSAVQVPAGTVVDEGVLHGVCAASLRIRTDISRVVRHVTLPDVVVRFRIPAEVAHRRVQGSTRTVAPMAWAEAAPWYADFEGAVEWLCRLLPVPIVAVDGGSSPADVTDEVLQALTERAHL